MAKNTKTTAQRIADETKFLVECGLDEAIATTVATNKVNLQDIEAQKKKDDLAAAVLEAERQATLDKDELTRIAGLLGINVPEKATRFVVSTVAIKEDQTIDGKVVSVEVGRRVSKVRLYFTMGTSKRASEINSLIKSFETEAEVLAEVDSAKMDLLFEIA
jgi:hypothetical protein